jgi:ATP-binding cassette subfamily C (CFTR/MRP) protein 1
MAATIGVAVFMGKAQAKWIQASQERVARTAATIGSIKWIKLSGLTDSAFSVIRLLRIHELKLSRRFRVLLIWVVAFCECPYHLYIQKRRFKLTGYKASMTPIISPVLTFITFTGLALRHNNALDISTAFTSLSLLTLLYKPLALVIGVLPLIASAMACFTRIQAYLNKPSWEDTRILRLISPSSKDDQVWSAPPSTGNQIELVQMDKGYQDVIATMHGRFQWSKNTEKFIDISEFKIRRQTFTLLLGPVGCGKSTVLKGLLGELPGFEGSINVASRGMAFCDQVPWLPNGTFRDIILGKSRFDQVWYQSVISACALEEDLRQWPQGDQSVIGSKGTTLSGGQKHRTVSI